MARSLPLIACALLAGPTFAQSNAESDLFAVGDLLGGGLQVEVDGAAPNAITYLLPSLDLSGSNYLVGLSGDPNDFLTVGIGLAQSGRLFTERANASGKVSFAIGVPNIPSLLDKKIYFQAFSVTGATTFEKFSNTATISINQAGRWQDLDDSPVPSANLAFLVDSFSADGSARSAFLCGGGPSLLTDEQYPYPTENR
ncbi:MAG: hypothetical protein MK209_05970, partial [Planctomycetes bacterium]|nr:hypothetical protein [Planctomycetota bacterium]